MAHFVAGGSDELRSAGFSASIAGRNTEAKGQGQAKD